MVHPRSMDFRNQRRVVLFRDTEGLSWETIASKVQNLKGENPSWTQCRNVYNSFNARTGHKAYKYKNCGRRREKVTTAVDRFLEKRLLALRHKVEVNASVLQRELAKGMGVKLESSTIRRALKRLGYRWLPRTQKRVYSSDEMLERCAFARRVLRFSDERLREALSFCMDGCVLSVPPSGLTKRENFCKASLTHVYRKRSEGASPALAGQDKYKDQVPMSRALPLWGGVSGDGFAEVAVHHRKKFDAEEWVAEVVRPGKLAAALAAVNPVRPRGPWTVLCDNESFLRTDEARLAHREAGVTLWKMPAHSPDLNPVEKFWAWLRKELRKRDLEDLAKKRPVLNKAAYLARVRGIYRSVSAKRVAQSCALGLKRVCREVLDKNGAATSG